MMTRVLVFLEGGVIFTCASAALLFSRSSIQGAGDVTVVLAAAAGLCLCVLTALHLADLYSLSVLRNFKALLGGLPPGFAAAALLSSALAALVPAARLTGNPIESGLLLTIGVFFGVLLPLRALASKLARGRKFVTRVLVVGTGSLAQRLIDEIQRRPDCGYVVVAAGEEWLDRIIEQVRPDRIVVAMTDRRGRLPTEPLLGARVSRGIPVEEAGPLYERLTGKLAIETLSPSELIFGEGFRCSPLATAIRRAVSLLVASLGLVAVTPLLCLIALAIKLDSRGPVFFAQRRPGLHGKLFPLLKFRTMHPVDRPPTEWAGDNGHRITRVGRWLRRFSLDELPQLVNIVRGEMDLVGPRPQPIPIVVLCRDNVSYYQIRLTVRPGLTGWAQVRFGYANDLEEETEKMRYDLYYIKHRSLWFDLRILFATAKLMLRGRPVIASLESHGVRAPQDGAAHVPLLTEVWPVAQSADEAAAVSDGSP